MHVASVRRKIPLPTVDNRLLAWGLVIIGLVWLYDSYDGHGRDLPFPFGAITPWLCVIGKRLCFATKLMNIPHEGMVMLICTEEHDHSDKHYDAVYLLEWD